MAGSAGELPSPPSSSSFSSSPNSENNGSMPYNTEVRHGFDVISKEWMSELAEGYFTYFADKRHEIRQYPREKEEINGGDWRITDRQRTVNAALVLCLNLGVDPPDIIKTHPAAKMEAWVDPQQYVDTKKALEQIGKNLQAQFESLSTRTKYKQSLDPNIDDIKRFCMGLRRSARDDRILFHYNGHGVPRPTPNGEIWVFNRGYTQYIPLSIFDLQTWLGAPVIYCYDCSAAGNIVKSFNEFVAKRKTHPMEEEITYNYDSCIQLGACRADEILPMNPSLPADLFTCCITTPVDIAVKWFLIQNGGGFAAAGLYPQTVQIPGKITDRRTPLGELNWIFTAITDTIAWSALDPTLFKRLFRQDLVVAAMFRNFLLACRIMRAHNCHPVSSPELPETCDHPLWDSWDAAVNHCLLQIATPNPASENRLFSDFFEQQLTAFEMWLTYRSADVTKAPEQLPILLQVLLSQIHRLRALMLLCRYLDLGPETVRIALSIGFFIYVLKLLQSPAPELKPVLVFIWARIMAVDRLVQTELVKEQGYLYFVNILTASESANNNNNLTPGTRKGELGDPAMCCFVLAQFAHDYPQAQHLLGDNAALLNVLESGLESESPLLRQWSCLLLAEILPQRSISKLLWRLKDPIPELRAASLYTMGQYLSRGELADPEIEKIGKAAIPVAVDGSSLVSQEFVAYLSQYVVLHEPKFLVCAFTTLEEEFAASRYGGDMRSRSPAHGTVCLALWRCLLVLTDDAMPQVALKAKNLVDYLQAKLLQTPLADDVRQMASVLLEPSELRKAYSAADPGLAASAMSEAHQASDERPPSESMLHFALRWIVGDDQPQPQLRTRSSRASLAPTSVPATPEQRDSPIDPSSVELPFPSGFREWCVEFFREPQLKAADSDEPGSKRYFERLWRKERNERIMAETQVQKGLAVSGTWGNQISSLEMPGKPPEKLAFAQFEPHLVAAHSEGVTVFDWQQSKPLNRFKGGRDLADIRLLNEDDSPLLLTASRDGIARVFRDYDDPQKMQIVTSWWLFSDLVHHQPHNPSVVLDWQQSRGALLIGGDARVIRVWDASREQTISDIPVRTSAQTTSITSDQVAGNLVFAGFSDGAVQVYDRRLDKKNVLVARWKRAGSGLHASKIGHTSRIISVRMQRGGPREVVSGSTDGQVCLWDIRSSLPVGCFRAHTREMRCFDIHEHAPVIGTASRVAGVWSTSGRRVSTLKCPTSSYLSSKVSPVGALTFHPHQMVLAMSNAEEPTVSVFRCVP